MLLQNKPFVEARDLSWVAASQGEAESWPLLAGLSFAIAAGERVLLTGPSGSGKSTLLRAIAGVLAQTETGTFSGELYVRGRCGLVLQDPANSFVAARLGNEVAFGPENLAVPEVQIRERVATVLRSVGLDFGPHRSVVQLSGGESQRMALAGILALSPEILLLDEPLSMLDSAAATTVRDAICAALADSPLTAALIVDHDVAPWAELVSRVMVLNAEGRIAKDVSIDEFLASSTGEPNVTPLSFDLGYRAANAAGQITAFVGPSGAGKTTELNRRLAKMSVAEVGWVPQQAELTIAGNTVWRSATATVRNLGLATDLASRLLEQLGLQDQASQNPHLLSGGEMRRLALVSALAHNPSYLILDEPTVGQDAETWRTVAGVILAAKQAGVSVLLATHDARLIALADEIVQVVAQPVAVTVAPSNGRVTALPALVISLALLVGSFIVSSVGVALWVLAGEAILTTACWRILPKQRAKRFAPIAIALASIWLSNAIFAASGVSQAGFERATFVALRTATFVLPSVVLAGALHPIELAASLVRWCRVPARPAMAAAAALVRLEFIQWQWAAVRQTRRLRGFAKGRTPVARTREFAASLFALLVQSLRSAGDLAVAMQARGFGEASAKRRTWVKF